MKFCFHKCSALLALMVQVSASKTGVNKSYLRSKPIVQVLSESSFHSLPTRSNRHRHLKFMSHSSSLVGHQTKSKLFRSLEEEKDWLKVGGDIQGKQLGSQFGDSVAISKEGDVIAVGARFKDTPDATNTGVVRIFKRNESGGWDQKGDDIAGKRRGDFFGKSIALSDDGSILAVGSPKYDQHGMVRVYKFDEEGQMWNLLGDDIGGVSDQSPIGCFISLSGDGLTLAISWDDNDGTGLNVRIFKFEDDSWVKIRTDALSPVEHENCPSVSLSEAGDILAMGGLEMEDDASSKGRVRVYQLADDEWSQMGQTIDEEDINLGKSVSLSDDGLSLATSGDGIVRIYHLAKETWVADEDIAHFGGKGVSLSGDGTKVAVGDSQDGEFCFEDQETACIDGPGVVEVYQQEGKEWKTLGSTMVGRTLVNNGDRFGFSVALSQNGESLVVGAPNRHKKNEFGYVSVFDFTTPPVEEPPVVTPGENDNSASEDPPTDPFVPGPSQIVNDETGRGVSTAAQISIGTVGGFIMAAAVVVVFMKMRKRKKDTDEMFPVHEPVSSE